jgi:uncharacterized membrane protein YuzA (DUF378 family)
MSNDWLLRIVLFSIIHWVLAGIMMTDLVARSHVLGGRKTPWLALIMLVPGFGSLVYMVFHPDILHASSSPDDESNHIKNGRR